MNNRTKEWAKLAFMGVIFFTGMSALGYGMSKPTFDILIGASLATAGFIGLQLFFSKK